MCLMLMVLLLRWREEVTRSPGNVALVICEGLATVFLGWTILRMLGAGLVVASVCLHMTGDMSLRPTNFFRGHFNA